MTFHRRTLVQSFSLAALLPNLGFAQSAWPAKPDAFARPLSAQFSKNSGKQLIIDNKGGAGGTVGASFAAKTPNDGYTFFMGAVHHAIAPSMYPKLDYNIESDLVPLVLAAVVPQVLVINPKKVPVNSYKEFLEFVKKNPGKLNYASAGGGTSHHLAGELFKLQTGTFITHIPYRGAGPALQDLIAGQVDLMFDGLGSSATHIKGGRIKALMVSGNRRNPAFPDVPCAGELGLPDYSVTTWYGIWGVKGTPADVLLAASDEFRKALGGDELKAIWAAQGADYPKVSTNQFVSFLNADIKRWATVVKASGAKLD
jgi:tripartite-type tricarboxylate transporter receptor subunit TctC